jgi:hypothetical protein
LGREPQTNYERARIRHWGFVILSSFDIRHSSLTRVPYQ